MSPKLKTKLEKSKCNRGDAVFEEEYRSSVYEEEGGNS